MYKERGAWQDVYVPTPTGFRIGRLGSLAGVAPTTLRAWERRYGLFHPARTTGGFRLYSETDLATARAMAELTSRGLSAGEAAAQLLAAPVEPAPVSPGSSADDRSFEALAHRLHQAVARMDEPGMQSLLDEIFGSYTIETAVERILLPELAQIGHEWSLGKMTIAQEHLASNIFRGRLAAHARGWGHGVGPAVVLACPPGEYHDLPLIAFGLALRSFGWRIIFLGTDTPVEEVNQVVERIDP